MNVGSFGSERVFQQNPGSEVTLSEAVAATKRSLNRGDAKTRRRQSGRYRTGFL
jgi:hypothetical protein